MGFLDDRFWRRTCAFCEPIFGEVEEEGLRSEEAKERGNGQLIYLPEGALEVAPKVHVDCLGFESHRITSHVAIRLHERPDFVPYIASVKDMDVNQFVNATQTPCQSYHRIRYTTTSTPITTINQISDPS